MLNPLGHGGVHTRVDPTAGEIAGDVQRAPDHPAAVRVRARQSRLAVGVLRLGDAHRSEPSAVPGPVSAVRLVRRGHHQRVCVRPQRRAAQHHHAHLRRVAAHSVQVPTYVTPTHPHTHSPSHLYMYHVIYILIFAYKLNTNILTVKLFM